MILQVPLGHLSSQALSNNRAVCSKVITPLSSSLLIFLLPALSHIYRTIEGLPQLVVTIQIFEIRMGPHNLSVTAELLRHGTIHPG